MKHVAIALFAASTLAVVGCKTQDGAAEPSAKTKPTEAPPSIPATAAPPTPTGCDLVAFEKDQTDNGRGGGKPRSFSGCKFKSYNEKSRTAFIDKNGASDSLACVNIDKPDVAPGDAVDIDGTVDGGGDLRMYRCVIKKRP